jgi:hypothetical protein
MFVAIKNAQIAIESIIGDQIIQGGDVFVNFVPPFCDATLDGSTIAPK